MKHIKTFENKKDDITFDWEKFKNYVDTYNPSLHGANDWHIILEDMLYGLGISIDEKEFKNHNGYKKFKQYLKDGIDWIVKKDSDKYNL